MSCGSDGTAGEKLTHSAVTRPELDNYDKKRRFVQCGKEGGVASWVPAGKVGPQRLKPEPFGAQGGTAEAVPFPFLPSLYSKSRNP
jgi:hypothetical protein